MGFFDKIKSAVNAVTGGGAKVTIESFPAVAFPGEPITVKVTATSTGGAVSFTGVWVDVQAVEEVRLKKEKVQGATSDIAQNNTTYSNKFEIAKAGTLAPNETKVFPGIILLPPGSQPSFDGALCDHGWGIRARIEMSGNDPDSGFQVMKVGQKV